MLPLPLFVLKVIQKAMEQVWNLTDEAAKHMYEQGIIYSLEERQYSHACLTSNIDEEALEKNNERLACMASRMGLNLTL